MSLWELKTCICQPQNQLLAQRNENLAQEHDELKAQVHKLNEDKIEMINSQNQAADTERGAALELKLQLHSAQTKSEELHIQLETLKRQRQEIAEERDGLQLEKAVQEKDLNAYSNELTIMKEERRDMIMKFQQYRTELR